MEKDSPITNTSSVLLRILFGLGIGVTGGIVFYYLDLPLPWMLAPVVFNIRASALRMPIGGPERMRPFVQLVIGIFLGSSFSPEVFDQIVGWLASLAILFVFLVVVAVVIIPYYRRIGGLDPVTSYFAAMPG